MIAKGFPMQPIIYDVAVSIDGFISGPQGDISGFSHKGEVVDDYMARLATYGTALMGRATYEFGYQYGLLPGANPYPNMRSYVVSSGIDLPKESVVSLLRNPTPQNFESIRNKGNAPIYLCGGGDFAGWMLRHGLISRLRLKRAPILLGSGVPLFSGDLPKISARLLSEKSYGDGTLYQEFDLA